MSVIGLTSPKKAYNCGFICVVKIIWESLFKPSMDKSESKLPVLMIKEQRGQLSTLNEEHLSTKLFSTQK